MKTFKDLMSKLDEIASVPFAELAPAHGVRLDHKNKSLAGDVVEAALGLKKNARAEADLSRFNLEVKTIPIDVDARVLWMTKVTALNFKDVEIQPWDESRVAHKLRPAVFAPVVKYDPGKPGQWFVRHPFVWLPSKAAWAQLKEDYEAVQRLIRAGRFDAISASQPPRGQGKFLCPNTGAQRKEDTVKKALATGQPESKRRAWMLRKEFTQTLIEENLRYRSAPKRLQPALTAFE